MDLEEKVAHEAVAENKWAEYIRRFTFVSIFSYGTDTSYLADLSDEELQQYTQYDRD